MIQPIGVSRRKPNLVRAPVKFLTEIDEVVNCWDPQGLKSCRMSVSYLLVTHKFSSLLPALARHWERGIGRLQLQLSVLKKLWQSEPHKSV